MTAANHAVHFPTLQRKKLWCEPVDWWHLVLLLLINHISFFVCFLGSPLEFEPLFELHRNLIYVNVQQNPWINKCTRFFDAIILCMLFAAYNTVIWHKKSIFHVSRRGFVFNRKPHIHLCEENCINRGQYQKQWSPTLISNSSSNSCHFCCPHKFQQTNSDHYVCLHICWLSWTFPAIQEPLKRDLSDPEFQGITPLPFFSASLLQSQNLSFYYSL